MVILYGFGDYARNILRQTSFLCSEIEVIIDENLSKQHKDIISWDYFLENRDKYKSNIIVIGVNYADIFSEIESNIIKSGVFDRRNIWTIERWKDEVIKNNKLLQLLH